MAVSDPAHLLRLFALSVLSFCPPWLVLFAFLRLPVPFLGVFSCACVIVVALLLNARGHTRVALNMICGAVITTLFVNSAFTGCSHSTLLFWTACTPLMATLIDTTKTGYVWCAVASAACALVHALDAFEWSAVCQTNVLSDIQSVLSLALAISLVVAVQLIASLFKNRVQEEIEARELYTLSIGHDLRSPLHGLLSTIDFLHETVHHQSEKAPTLEELREQLDTAKRCGAIVSGVLRSVSETSWLHEVETVVLSQRTYKDACDEMRAVLWGVIAPKSSVAAGALPFELHCAPASVAEQAQLLMTLDTALLCRLLSNLSTNAVKYGGGGDGIVVRVDLSVPKTSNEERCELTVDVIDSGSGIAEKNRKAVFDKYARLTHGHVSGISGRGVGLYLCRRIVEQLGGTIGVANRSDDRSGAHFRFTIPVAVKREAARPPSPSLPPLSSAKSLKHLARNDDNSDEGTGAPAAAQLLLTPRSAPPQPATQPFEATLAQLVPFDAVVIDDSALNCRLLSQYLSTSRGAALGVNDIASFQRVDEAYEHLRSARCVDDKRRLVVLLDLQLGPHQPTGHEFVRTIRRLEEQRRIDLAPISAHPLICIAVTASVTPAVRAQCANEGFDNFLAKPCSRTKVAEIIKESLG